MLAWENGWTPSRDTIHRILVRHDLVRSRKPRRQRTHPGAPDQAEEGPNRAWAADFKGSSGWGTEASATRSRCRTDRAAFCSAADPCRDSRRTSCAHVLSGSSHGTGSPTAFGRTTERRSHPCERSGDSRSSACGGFSSRSCRNSSSRVDPSADAVGAHGVNRRYRAQSTPPGIRTHRRYQETRIQVGSSLAGAAPVMSLTSPKIRSFMCTGMLARLNVG